MSEIILILYHLLPYNAFDTPEASNGRSDNHHDPNHLLPGDNNVSDAPSNNPGKCNDQNPDWLFTDDSIDEFYNATTYNILICNKFNPEQIF